MCDGGGPSRRWKWLAAALEKGDTTVFVTCDVSSGTVPGCVSAFLNGASTPCAMYGGRGCLLLAACGCADVHWGL